MTRVHFCQLNKIFFGRAQVHAVKNLSLKIDSGRITAILGPSGCGKTTLLKMVAGLLPPTSGDIRFNGHSVLTIPAERREAVMVFQNHLLFPYMTVGENVGFGLRMRHIDQKIIKKKVADMLDLVQLSGFESRRPQQLSGGQQQRVALARAMVIEPQVLLLDEPLSNLDAHLRDEMRELILNIQRQLNITTILVTHDQEEAVVLADKIALLFEGELQQFDYPPVFYQRPANEKVARFFGGVNFLGGEKQNGYFNTCVGRFRINHQPIADGPATLTIRPESLTLDGTGENTIQARICSKIFVGTQMRFKVDVGQEQFVVITDPSTGEQFQAGDPVSLTVSKDRIWLIPSNSPRSLTMGCNLKP
jgi:ABC-type Fe3+/spermidine/putrescine transport system ATPase subunit